MRNAGIVLTLMALASAALSAAEPIAVQPIWIGPGPISKIRYLTGRDFDSGYISTMYQQNAEILGVAEIGGERARDSNIRRLSRKIALERLDMNDDLKRWYWIFANRVMPKPGSARCAGLQQALCDFRAGQFDCAYASVMIGLMRQSREAADKAIDISTIPELVQQARVIYRTDSNEIRAFERWQETGRLR